MNLRLGDQASDMYPNDSVRAEKLRKKLALMNKVTSISNVVTDVITQAPPGATADEINAEVKERLHPTKKTPYLMYAALAVGAYLMFK